MKQWDKSKKFDKMVSRPKVVCSTIIYFYIYFYIPSDAMSYPIRFPNL